jgi:hypothetical protein
MGVSSQRCNTCACAAGWVVARDACSRRAVTCVGAHDARAVVDSRTHCGMTLIDVIKALVYSYSKRAAYTPAQVPAGLG